MLRKLSRSSLSRELESNFFLLPVSFQWLHQHTRMAGMLHSDRAPIAHGRRVLRHGRAPKGADVELFSRLLIRVSSLFFGYWRSVSNRIPNHICCFGGELYLWDYPSFVIMVYVAHVSRI